MRLLEYGIAVFQNIKSVSKKVIMRCNQFVTNRRFTCMYIHATYTSDILYDVTYLSELKV